MKRWKKSFALLLAGAMLLSAGGCGSGEGETSTGNAAAEFDPNSAETRAKTREIEELINSNYYFEKDAAKMDEAYYDGLIRGLGDKYATYFTPEEYKQDQEDDSGEYVGIGCTVSQNMESGAVYVVEPMPGSPSEEAGLLPEDIFVEIDGTELTTDMDLEAVVKMIRGSANTTAHLKMYRSGEDDFLEFDVERRKIQSITVTSEVMENGVGYIKVNQFIETTAAQFRTAVDSVISQGAKAIVFDFRNNPGGLTDSALQMVDYIVPDKTVPEGGDPSKPGLLLEMRDKNEKILYKDYTKDGHEVLLPMAVLMNGNSASSSEIFIGCLRDYGKVVMVGEKSYGKGIVQVTYPLSDGSAVKMTVAQYFLPAGTSIHESGIVPDYEVELPIEKLRILNKLPHNEDPQLAKALEVLGMDPLPAPAATEGDTTESAGTEGDTTESAGTEGGTTEGTGITESTESTTAEPNTEN